MRAFSHYVIPKATVRLIREVASNGRVSVRVEIQGLLMNRVTLEVPDCQELVLSGVERKNARVRVWDGS